MIKRINSRPTEPWPKPIILREVIRHYTEYRALVMSPSSQANEEGRISSSVAIDHGVIEYAYPIYEDDGETIKGKEAITLSFWDLQGGLRSLSPRKREAIYLNVICDLKQKTVAEIMSISTVSVGQYVHAGMTQLSQIYFL